MRSIFGAWLVAVHVMALALASSAGADERNYEDPRRDGTPPWMGLKNPCREAFDAVVAPIIARCSSYTGRLERADLIKQARDTLVAKHLIPASAFEGVTIHWCPLNGSGMVPEKNLILLNPALQSSLFKLTSILGHEMKHVEQYRRWGTDGFKCRYGEEIANLKGQGRSNSVEREAYEFQDRVEAALKDGSGSR
jgi:hypothetical protein